MNTNNNINAVLSSLNADTQAALADHFKKQILSTLTATLNAPTGTTTVDGSTDTEAPAKRPGRPKGSKNSTTKKEDSDKPKRGPGRPKGSTKKEKVAEASSKRQHAEDGRSASQVIRDYDAQFEEFPPAADVVAHCAELGLEVAPALVYNVRQNLKKAEEAAAAAAAKEAKKAAKKKAAKKAAKTEKPAKAEKPAKKASAKKSKKASKPKSEEAVAAE